MSVKVSIKLVSESFYKIRRILPSVSYSRRHFCSRGIGDGSSENNYKNISNKEWMQRLTPLQYDVCRLKGTEHPFTSSYLHTHLKGTYCCVCCGTELFSSETKYDSGSGWPSFFSCIPGKVEEKKDTSHGMVRVEVLCKNCNAHLGHVFDDGPKPTGHRYCINGVCLNFKEQ